MSLNGVPLSGPQSNEVVTKQTFNLISNSSSIVGWRYDDDNRVLTVDYGPTQYEYYDVPASLIQEVFEGNGSLGRKLRQRIRGYKYQKI